MTTLRASLSALLLLVAAAACAGTSPLDLEVVPASPVAFGDPVYARVHSSECVALVPGLVPVRSGATLLVKVPIQDFCQPVGPQARSYALEPLAPGRYDVVLESCAGNVPPGASPCSEVERLPLVVVGIGAAASVPATGWTAFGLLAALTLLAGNCRLR